MSNDPTVAIVGVTGAVGAEFIATMDKRNFRVGKLKALASARSAGQAINFRGEQVVIEELTPHSFHGVDIALFYWQLDLFFPPKRVDDDKSLPHKSAP